MTVVFSAPGVTLHHGDCIEVMRSLPDNSVHAVVTDPPYGLEFMSKGWDGADGFRRSLNENDAGRDSVFGRTSRTSPESTGRGNKGILPGYGRGGTSEDRFKFRQSLSAVFGEWCDMWVAEALRVLKPGGHLLAFGGSRTWHRLAVAVEDAGFEIRDSIAWLYGSGFPKNPHVLKPAFEPIVVGRKALIGTVAANVDEHGTGALNIDANRIEASGRPHIVSKSEASAGVFGDGLNGSSHAGTTDVGRWPTNVVLDDSQAAELDAQTGILKSGANPARRGADGSRSTFGEFGGQVAATPSRGADEGGASRFFPTFRYEAKAGADERPNVDGVLHPTVKPLDLMRWLVRLATPEGGTILEPFAGSGTTLEAALLEGFSVIGIEREATYLPLIEARITKPLQVTMF
jgi:site-specific DNA-methyltransferase (adenine-specific)